jgi:uncharacterized membrane protein YkoI
MKTLSKSILFLLASFGMGNLRAQTADEIVNKYISAIGGKEVLNGIKTIYEEGTLELNGNEAPSTTYIVSGKAFKNIINFNGQEIVQCVTDKGGWAINPMMGQTTATALTDDQMKSLKLSMDVAGPLVDYAAKGNKVELTGKDTTAGVICYKLKLTTKDKVEIQLFIDAKTYYIVKSITEVPAQGEAKTTFTDYRKTDFGFVMPFSMELALPAITFSMVNKKIEINKAIDPAIFDMPK